MLKVIVMNAKYPRSGKDTAADHMVDMINSCEETSLPAFKRNFKDSLIKATCCMLGISEKEFLLHYDTSTEDVLLPSNWRLLSSKEKKEYAWYKDYPLYVIDTKIYSKREALIHCSEKLFKVMLGDRVFGDMLVKALPEEGVVFVGDSGFVDELLPVINKVGRENVLVCRIHRDVKNPPNDSRALLEENMFSEEDCPLFFDFDNNDTEAAFKTLVTLKIGGWVNAA